MDKIREIIIRKNFKYVATILNGKGDMEELIYDGSINIDDVILGMAELNKNNIILVDINVGNSREGISKIANIHSMGLYINGEYIKEPEGEFNIPEVNIIPFKSDSWVLGEFIVRHKTGKGIPRKFLKSQNLLDKFTEGDDVLRKLLVLDPVQRSFTWEILQTENQKNEICNIQ